MARELPSVDELNAWSPGTLPGLLGIRITSVEEGRVTGEMPVRPDLLAPNGYLHAASVVGLADTISGYGTRAHLPEGSRGFTTKTVSFSPSRSDSSVCLLIFSSS